MHAAMKMVSVQPGNFCGALLPTLEVVVFRRKGEQMVA